MGEHQQNAKAILEKMKPSLPGLGFQRGFGITATVEPKPTIHIAAKEDIREEGGITQIHELTDALTGASQWTPLPPGHKVVIAGEPLAPEDCLIVVRLVSQWADVKTPIAMPDGNTAFKTSTIAVADLAALDFQTLTDAHMNDLANHSPIIATA